LEGGNKEDGSGWEKEFIHIAGTGGDTNRLDCKERRGRERGGCGNYKYREKRRGREK
jgi:hypothetical protein